VQLTEASFEVHPQEEASALEPDYQHCDMNKFIWKKIKK